ncbi:MAG: GNAT family N-acetyltransferase [Alphaproteobacteria bacterium]
MLHIRQAFQEDSLSAQELIFRIWHDEYGFDVSLHDAPDLGNLSLSYPGHNALFLVAFQDNRLVGTAAYSLLTQSTCVLKRFFVQIDVRRTGIGQQLFNELYERLLGQHQGNPFSLYLSTKRDDAKSAKAFYLKNGFRIIKQKDLPSGFPFFYQDDLFMVK